MTWPCGTRSLNDSSTVPGTSPAALTRARASASVRCVTSGTATSCGPFETVSVTVLPLRSRSPGTGSEEITLPRGTVSEKSLRTVTSRPAPLSRCSASACGSDSTPGTCV